MTSKLCVMCSNCLTVALDSPCECGAVASRFKDSTLFVYCDDPNLATLSKVWVNESGIISFFKRYKDLGLAKIVPINYKKDKF